MLIFAQGFVSYQLPTNLTWSSTFREIESNKERLGIVDYSVSQTTLDQVIGELLLPHAHAPGVKQSVLSVVSTKIARTEDLGIVVVDNCDQIVRIIKHPFSLYARLQIMRTYQPHLSMDSTSVRYDGLYRFVKIHLKLMLSAGYTYYYVL